MPLLVRYFVHCLRTIVDRKFMVVMVRGGDIWREATCFVSFNKIGFQFIRNIYAQTRLLQKKEKRPSYIWLKVWIRPTSANAVGAALQNWAVQNVFSGLCGVYL